MNVNVNVNMNSNGRPFKYSVTLTTSGYATVSRTHKATKISTHSVYQCVKSETDLKVVNKGSIKPVFYIKPDTEVLKFLQASTSIFSGNIYLSPSSYTYNVF